MKMTIDGDKKWISATYHPSGEYSLIYTIDGIRYVSELSKGTKISHLRTRKIVPILGANDNIQANNFKSFYRSDVLTNKEYNTLSAITRQILSQYFTIDNDVAGSTEHSKPL